MITEIEPYQQTYSHQPLEVEALWLQNVVFILLAIGMIAYFIKVGPAAFFERALKE